MISTSTALALLGLSSIYKRMKMLTSIEESKSGANPFLTKENVALSTWHNLNSILFLLQLLRSLLVAASFQSASERSKKDSLDSLDSTGSRQLLPFDLLTVDSFARFATANRQLYDPYIALSFACIFVFAYGNNRLFHQCFTRPEIRCLIEQLLVSNTEVFLSSNRRAVAAVQRIVHKFGSFESAKAVSQCVAVYHCLWRSGSFPLAESHLGRKRSSAANDVRFSRPLADFTFLSSHDRLRLVLVMLAFEVIIKAVSVVLIGAMVLFSSLYGVFLWSTSTRIFWLAFAILDALVVYYCCWIIIINGFLNLILSVLFYIIFKANYKRVNLRLEFLRTGKSSQKMHQTSMASAARFDHGTLTNLLLRTDHLFWSALFLVFALANAPPNVYFVTFLYFKAEEFFEVFGVGFILALQSCAILTFLFPASVSQLAHQAAKTVLPVGARSASGGGSSSIRLRWKYSIFFEEVSSPTKIIGYTIGSLEVITRSNLIRVSVNRLF